MATNPEPGVQYRAETITGERWRRAYRVTIQNPYLGTPTVAFDEEEITSFDGSVKAQSTGTLALDVNFDSAIALLNPADGAPLLDANGAQQSMTQGQIYVALYSLYIALGTARDAATPAVPAAPV